MNWLMRFALILMWVGGFCCGAGTVLIVKST